MKKTQQKPTLDIKVYQHDWIPGFAAMLNDGSIDEKAEAHVVLNLGSILCAVKVGDVPREDMPYMIAECLMHEVIHVLEAWAGAEFNEDRVEALIEKYQEYLRQTTELLPKKMNEPSATERADTTIFVRYYNGTYIARWRGKIASATACQKYAADRVAKKVLGDREFELTRCGSDYAWNVVEKGGVS
jgi:hypothetical protein